MIVKAVAPEIASPADNSTSDSMPFSRSINPEHRKIPAVRAT
jgi:hypothetical protein